MFSVRYQLLRFSFLYLAVYVKAGLFYDAESCRRRTILAISLIED
jgi:hypothetical protein